MHRVFNWLSYVILLCGFAGIIVCAYWLMWPYKTTEWKTPMPVLTKTIKPGGMLKYIVDYNKHADKECTISKQFVNSFILTLSPYVSNAPVGRKRVTAMTKVPEVLPAGKCTLRITIIYNMNPLRKIIKVIESEEFDVIK